MTSTRARISKWLPGASGRGRDGESGAAPLELWLEDKSAGVGRMCVLHEPFRLGFGAECDIRLEGEEGPDVLFEVEQARGPLLVARALAPSEYEGFVDLTLNGEPLRGQAQGLSPGSRLDVVDKHSGRRYQVVVSPVRSRLLRPRNLALLILVLSLAGAGFGGYLYWSLERARSELSRTGSRVEQAEADLARTEGRVREFLDRIEYTEAGFQAALDELRQLGSATARAIRAEFAERVQRIEQDSREALARLAERDTAGRDELLREARRQTEALRGEFSDRMVESYRELQALERRLLDTLAERIAAREPAGERMKRIFADASESVLLILTRYEVEFVREGSVSEMASFGTGFVVSPGGLAITAQHVLYPWRHDRDLVVLERLGLVRVDPDSVRWHAWRRGARALRDPGDPESVDVETAYASTGPEPTLRLLHAREPEFGVQMVPSPVGVVEVPVPVPGASDSAVLQIVDFAAPMPHLALAPATSAPSSLDEVLLVGYPYSRLQDGVAAPQGVRGFVRRQTGGLLELDAAVHPGLSGGAVLDRDGALVGMVMATLRSDVYAVALARDELVSLLGEARERVRADEARLAALGCDPGDVDGTFDARTAQALSCARAREPEAAPDPAAAPEAGATPDAPATSEPPAAQ